MYSHIQLHTFAREIFLKIGCSKEDAQIAADTLIAADLSGVDSHGIARLSGYYRLWEAERINATPKIKVTYETPSTAVVDGDRGLGLVVAPFAMKVAMQKAKEVGTGWVSVRNTNHFGIAGQHAKMCIPNDMVGIAMTNASPLVAPTYSREQLLGTNPIAVAIPTNNQPPFLVDMATTTAANGKLEILQRKGVDAPLGWIQDKDGLPTENPHALKEGGALLPLGGDREHGSHKGYCLGAVVDIFSAIFSGANYGPWVPPFVSFLPVADNLVGEGIGHFFGAMRVDAFRPAEEFKSHMDNWITRFRKAETIPGQDKVLIPGDPEREMEADRKVNGIPLNEKVVDDIRDLSEKTGISF